MASSLVNPSEHTQEICHLFIVGLSCEQIAERFPDSLLGIFDVYGALLWLDSVIEMFRQVRPDEWETVVDNL